MIKDHDPLRSINGLLKKESRTIATYLNGGLRAGFWWGQWGELDRRLGEVQKTIIHQYRNPLIQKRVKNLVNKRLPIELLK